MQRSGGRHYDVPVPAPAPAPDRPSAHHTALALAIAGIVALGLLAPQLSTFGSRLWGPERPWSHRDFLGAWWLFRSSADVTGALAGLSWPDGAGPLAQSIPNPFDALLLGPLVARAPFPLWWNLLQLGHHLGNVLAATWLCRCLGARAGSAAVAGALVAASPLMLHEIAGGRTLSGAVWPGLLGLALLLRGQSIAAGLFIGVQGLFYIYTGMLVGMVALLLRPSWGLFAAALPIAPYLWWLAPTWAPSHARPPDAGFTRLPLAGLLGLGAVHERYIVHPLLLLGLPASLRARGGWRLALGILLIGLVALGPTLTWADRQPLMTLPLSWAAALWEPLGRLHHPIRAGLVLVPLLAVGLTRLLDRLPGGPALLLLVLPWAHAVQMAAPTVALSDPAGIDAARWLALHGEGAVVDLTGQHGDALALQPVHGRPILEGLRRASPAGAPPSDRLRGAVEPWLRGEQVAPSTLAELHAAGFTHVLAVPRGDPLPDRGLDADLGDPVFPQVYAIRSPPAGTTRPRRRRRWSAGRNHRIRRRRPA